MATNTLTIGLPSTNIENISVEEHVRTLIEKLEQMKQTKEEACLLNGKKYRQPMQVEIRTLEFWRSIISECLATFFFVFIVSGAGLLKGNETNVILTTAMAAGFSMMTLNHCFSSVSGAHMNPAVSIAFAVTKKISPLRAGMFVMAQCGGGIAGAALLYGVKLPGAFMSSLPVGQLGSWERFGLEFTLTFVVVFTHCIAQERRILAQDSLLIGAAYLCCTLVDVPMLNPARALGPAFVTNKLWENHWVFWFGPVTGGLVAAIIYEFIFNKKRQRRRPKDSIDGDSSSIRSEDENFDDKFRGAPYRPVAHSSLTSPNGAYCSSVASGFSSPANKLDRMESLYGGNRFKSPPCNEAIYSGSRSLYNARVTDNGIYSGAKSVYTKSPPLTRANLNRSQSVYTKQNPRDILPPPGPLVPAQSLYPITNHNNGFLNSNIREFASPDGNFITGIKNNDGDVVKVNFNQTTLNFLANRGSKSHHDLNEPDKTLNTGHNAMNQNLQNQNRQNVKPDKSENIYGVRNSPTGGIYPGSEPPKKAETEENPRNRTAAYVRSVQNTPKTRDNYDIVPNQVREYKPNRSETSDYGSNQSETSYKRPENINERTVYGSSHPDKSTERPDLSERGKARPPLPAPNTNIPNIPNYQLQPQHTGMPNQLKRPNGPQPGQIGPLGMNYFSQTPRQSPLSSVSSSSFSRNSPNAPY